MSASFSGFGCSEKREYREGHLLLYLLSVCFSLEQRTSKAKCQTFHNIIKDRWIHTHTKIKTKNGNNFSIPGKKQILRKERHNEMMRMFYAARNLLGMTITHKKSLYTKQKLTLCDTLRHNLFLFFCCFFCVFGMVTCDQAVYRC